MKVEVCLETYKNHLWKQVNKKIDEGSKLKDIVCKEEVSSLLREVCYPYEEILKISIASDNPIKISKQLEDLKDWSSSRQTNKCKKLVSLLEELEAGRYLSISEEDMSRSIDAHESYYRNRIKTLAEQVGAASKSIKWKNYDIKIEAVLEDLEVNEVYIYVEGEKSMILSLNEPSGRVIESKYSSICESLLKALKEQKEKSKISTFYMPSSYHSNNILEDFKKQIVLGQKCYLPEGTILSKVKSNTSKWKIKLEENNLLKLEEGYVVGPEDARIRFIEKL